MARAIDIPIMYYNLPSATWLELTAAQLRDLPIASLKDTGGDATAATELIQTEGPTLLNGALPVPRAPELSGRREGCVRVGR
jgi:dihydrodipicolinate synthase/N-acetylneuraminate lyase